MEEKNYGYTPENDDYDDYGTADVNKSLRGYKIVICILAVILAALSILYYNINRQQQRDYELLSIERDSIQSDLGHLIDEYDDLKYQNDTISASLERANEMMEQLKRERRLNYAKIKEYEKEVGTLRSVMKTYLRQIDSLNNLNKKLIDENVSYRKEISSANLRADFTISANELTAAGNREIYLRVTAPDGYVLSTEDTPTFTFEGGTLNYSAARDVDYQNEDVDVSIFYNGSGFTGGTYTIQVYADGYLAGTNEVVLK